MSTVSSSLLLLLLVVGTIEHVKAAVQLDPIRLNKQWSHWKRVHDKQYANEDEHDTRRGQWLENVREIMQHNLNYDLGLVSYSMGLNAYADLSWMEFRDRHAGGFRFDARLPSENKRNSIGTEFNMSDLSAAIPEELDWRKLGSVRDVKNQGHCGSCWAFSATGAIEGQYARKFGGAYEFSEQQLVDCSGPYGNQGCDGGMMENAFDYLKRVGLEQESAYPYHARVQRCEFDEKKATVMVKSYETVYTGNEQALQAMVATRGPASVAVDVDKGFQFYTSGIYVSRSCSSVELNHGVLVVGYGHERGAPYWIIKNSWGRRWGEDGYIRLARNHRNMCGVATAASVPEIV